jgi:hypothetical protein
MKKLLLIAFAFLINSNFLSAQNSKTETKPAQTSVKSRSVPVKMAVQPVAAEKKQTPAKATEQGQTKEGTATTKPVKPAENNSAQQTKPVMKKDGTPDKRYKENQNLKKDGTPDKRFKENKPADGKK